MSQISFHGSTHTIKIAASTASTNMALSVNGAQPQVQIANAGLAWANVTFGTSAIESSMATTAASSPGYMVGPNATMIVTPGRATYMAAALSSGTQNVFATPGIQV